MTVLHKLSRRRSVMYTSAFARKYRGMFFSDFMVVFYEALGKPRSIILSHRSEKIEKCYFDFYCPTEISINVTD